MQTSKISTPRVRFIRPVNYNVPVAPYATAGAVCLSPLRQDRPCKEFGVQADLNNGSWVAVGFREQIQQMDFNSWPARAGFSVCPVSEKILKLSLLL